jgi:PGF-CTERM protein
VTDDAYQSSLRGDYDIFVCKLSSDGSQLLYSTYLGGSKEDKGTMIDIGTDGSIIIAGVTKSTDFPIVVPYTQFGGGEWDVVLASFSSTYHILRSSRYIGGEDNDLTRGMDLGLDGSIYLVGETGSSDFPQDNTYVGNRTGLSNAFLLSIGDDAHTIEHSTLIGGTASDIAVGFIPTDPDGGYLVGKTSSDDFPMIGGGDGPLSIHGNIFICNVDGSGEVDYTTTFGSSGTDGLNDIASDGRGNIYMTGTTDSIDHQTSGRSFQSEYGGGDNDAFCMVYNLSREELDYVTYLGGQGMDLGFGIATTGHGTAAIIGWTKSGDFPVTDTALQPNLNGTDFNAFITRIVTDTIPPEIEYDNVIDRFPRGALLPLTVNVTDNIEVDGMYMIYRYGDGEVMNTTFNSSDYLEIPQMPGGDLTFHFAAVDRAGNWNITVEYEIDIVNTPPSATQMPTWHVEEGTNSTYPLYQYVSDLNGDPVTASCSDPNITVDNENLTLHQRVDVDGPDWTVMITLSDGEDESVLPLKVHVVNVNDPPVIISIQPANGSKFKEGTTITFTVSAYDEDGDELIYAWGSDGVKWGNEATIEYSGLKPGNQDITVRVSDGTYSTREQFTITIKEEEQSPGFGLVIALVAVVLTGLAVRRLR